MTRFVAFCHSPYFNKHDQVKDLVSYLSLIYPQFDPKKCDRKQLFKKVFGSIPFDYGKLALVFTYTQRCLNHFIAQEQFEGHPKLKDLLLLEGLKDLSQYTAFEKALGKLELEQSNPQSLNAEHYYINYRLAKNADDYYILLDRRQMDKSLEKKQLSLDYFYILEKLKDACEAKVREKILKVNYVPDLLPEVLSYVETSQEQLETAPIILVYYRIYEMLSKVDQVKHYYQAVSYLTTKTDWIEKGDLEQIYIYLMNYCIAKINKGENEFLKEIFELYKAQLDQGLLLEDNELSEWDYKNIVTTAIRLGEMDWVFDFIESYKDRLSHKAKENAYRFNLASFHYAKGNYGEVLGLLTKVEYSDLRYNMGAKALLLRTYYDLGEYDLLHSLTESTRQYLLRNKLLSETRRERYNNLFRLTRKAASLRAKKAYLPKSKAQQELKKLTKEVKNTPLMGNREWLMEKIEQLEG